MTWFKVDDKLHSHKKAARAGVAAMGLWTVAGSWCADHLTDGFVPDYIAERLAPGEADELGSRLVTAGLWTFDEHDGDKGWRFKDWDEYQPTRGDVESKREYERTKKARQRRDEGGQFTTSRGESLGDTDGESLGESHRPDPSRPVPNPEGQDKARKRAHQLPADWKPNDSHREKATEFGVNADGEAEAFRDHHLAHGKAMKDWDRAFHTWLRNTQKFGANARASPASRDDVTPYTRESVRPR